MLRQRHGDGKISGIADSGGFTEYEGKFLFRQKDIDGACLETAEASGKKSTTVFFGGYMCSISDNEEKLYQFLRELLLSKPSSVQQTTFRNEQEIKP